MNDDELFEVLTAKYGEPTKVGICWCWYNDGGFCVVKFDDTEEMERYRWFIESYSENWTSAAHAAEVFGFTV
jgi:hypothetical protein